jgi:O-methyltransferase
MWPSFGSAPIESILHDWDDEGAAAILRTCRRAIGDGGALLVFERDLGRANEAPEVKFSDLNMLVMLGGRERALEDFAALFEATGLRLVRRRRQRSASA